MRSLIVVSALVLVTACQSDPTAPVRLTPATPVTVASKTAPDTLILSNGRACRVPVATFQTVALGEIFPDSLCR